MPRRPTASRSDRERLDTRLNDAAEELNDEFGGEEIHAPNPFPFVVWLSATEETCVDEARNIHRLGGTLWRVPQRHPGVSEPMGGEA